MRVLGIDPGVALTGWGVIDVDERMDNGLKYVDCGVIETEKHLPQEERLMELRSDLETVISEFTPDHMALELLFFANNVKTAIRVGEARGVILLAVAENRLPVKEFTPLQVKDAVCGYGKAPKRQVQEMVQSILGLSEIPKPDDAADGLAVAVCCASSLKMDEALNSAE